MTETQKRIQAYKNALPGMKERVSAVALLLVVSISMMTSATFAWMTLSRNPEISSITTTVTTNGNLEIALSDTDGKEPNETTVHDGGGDVTKTNLTWGNLINLSSASYGLDYLILRPASLNSSNLVTSPLYAVEYAEDGRVTGYFTDFSFSNFHAGTKAFRVPEDGLDYGVRAVSSVKYEDVEGNAFFKNQMISINQNAANAKNTFNQIIGNNTYMSTISALVGIHVSVVLDDTDLSCVQHIDSLVAMIKDFQASVDSVGQTMVDIANLHLYIQLRALYPDSPAMLNSQYESQKVTLEKLKENNFSNATYNTYKSKIAGLDDYVILARKTKIAYDGIMAAKQVHVNTGNVYWQANLEAPANQLCNMSTATLDGKTVSQLSQDITGTASMIFSGRVLPAQLNDGALKDLDVMLGEPTMTVSNMPISVKVPKVYNGTSIPLVGGTTQTIKVNITTAAKNSGTVFILPGDLRDAEETAALGAGANYKGQAIAADTYAMAIDFWVRTNDANPLLILEGEYQYREDRVPVYGSDAAGNQVPLYTYTTKVDGEDVSYDVYQIVSGDVTTWYYAADHSELTAEELNGVTPTKQETIEKVVVGYKGVNRVWDELNDPTSNASQQIFGTSTTQGSGSCYIFYPTTPEDQAQGLKILGAMRVAFANEKGDLLGEAAMDVENAIEDAGRVIVPLKMRPQNPVVIGVDPNGNPITSTDYITRLNQNEAKRITALVYLEGANLSNSDVLAAGSINGQLNIQFGTNEMDMEPLEDRDVMDDFYTFAWQMPSQVNGVPVASTKDGYEIVFEDGYSDTSDSLDLKLLIGGAQPTSVKGNFVSYISSTQGARERVFTMFQNEDGFWEAYTYEEDDEDEDDEGTWVKGAFFSGPGLYRLRTLQIDGVDFVLPEGQRITYEIEGTKITGLSCTGWGDVNEESSFSILTAQDVFPQEMTMTVSTSQGAVPSIQAVFLGDNGKTVTANFTKVGDIYRGTANFTSSGTYKLTYAIVDGTYTQLDPNLYKTLSIRLGLRANVVVNQPMNEECVNLRDAMADDVLTKAEKALLAQYPDLTDIANGDDVLDENEKKLVDSQLNGLLQLLHYGNGIEGDENETGLSLQQVNGNWSIINDGDEDLFMDVSCFITDDLGNELKNLGNVELFYTAGSIHNTLTAGLKDGKSGVQWNPSTSRYEGTFRLSTSSLGMYRFDKLTIGGAKNTVTAADSAPTITSIAPTPMSVVKGKGFADLVYDEKLLNGQTEQAVYLTLRDAAAAQLQVNMLYGLGDKPESKTIVVDGYDTETAVSGDHKDYTFKIPLNQDGYWKLEGIKVSNVFYGGKFYAGDGEDGWLTLSADDLIEGGEENADTYFLTEVTLSANKVPSSANIDFMAATDKTGVSTTCSGMYITVNNQNRPLADVLTEVAELYPDENVNKNVKVGLTYTYKKTDTSWSVSDTSKLPNVLGNANISLNSGQYTLPAMPFNVDGTYTPDFTLTIGNTTYSAPGEMLCTGVANQLETPVTVKWNAPDVQVTNVTGAQFDSTGKVTGYSTFSVDLSSDSYSENYNPITGVKNYFEPYYANVYIASTDRGEHQIPTVTLEVKSGFGSATEATVASTKDSFGFTSVSKANEQSIGTTSGSWPQIANRVPAGEQKFTTIVMKYGDATYTMPLKQAVVINQDKLPLYLKYTSDNANVAVPAIVFSPDGREYTINLATVTPWTLQLTDYVSSGTPTSTESTVYVFNHTESEWFGLRTRYYYDKYTRITSVTEAVTTSIVDDVTYSVVRWAIGNEKPDAGSKFTITGQQTASSIVEETNRRNVSTTTKNQRTTVIRDTVVQLNMKDGTSARTSGVVTEVYTSDRYPNGYSYTEDLS